MAFQIKQPKKKKEKISYELKKYIRFYEADTGNIAENNLNDFYDWVNYNADAIDSKTGVRY